MDDSTLAITVLAIMVVTLLASGATLFWIFRAQSRRLAVPQSIGTDGGIRFPVRAIYARAGWFGSSRNSINPEFVVGPSGIDLRVIRHRHLDFGEIEQADTRKTLTGEALVLHARGGRVFVMRFGEAEQVRRVLTLLPAGAIPLTEAAATLRDGHAAGATPGLARYRGPLA